MSEVYPQPHPELTALADEMQYEVPRNLASAEALAADVRRQANALEVGLDGTYQHEGQTVDPVTAQKLIHLAKEGVEHWRLSPEDLIFDLELTKSSSVKDLDPDMQEHVRFEQGEDGDEYAAFERMKREAQARLKLHREIRDFYGDSNAQEVTPSTTPTSELQDNSTEGSSVAPEPTDQATHTVNAESAPQAEDDAPASANEDSEPTAPDKVEELKTLLGDWLKSDQRESKPLVIQKEHARRPTKQQTGMRTAEEIRNLTGVDERDDDFKRRLLVEELTDVLGHVPSKAELAPHLPKEQSRSMTPQKVKQPQVGSTSPERDSNTRRHGLRSTIGRIAARFVSSEASSDSPVVDAPVDTSETTFSSLVARMEAARRNAEATDESDTQERVS